MTCLPVSNRLGWLAVATLSATMMLGACSSTFEEDTLSVRHNLLPAESCEDVRERVVQTSVEEILRQRYNVNRGWDWGGGGWEDVDFADASPAGNNMASPAPGADRESPADFTETNIQEAGVDEPDIVKTDGQFIYTIHGNSLVIMKSWPADETEVVGRYSLGSAYPSSLFLRGDRVALFSQVYQGGFNGTRISLIDVSDRTEPRLEQQLDIEGNFVSARMLGGEVYLVSNTDMRSPVDTWKWVEHQDHILPPKELFADEARNMQLRRQARHRMRTLVRRDIQDLDVLEFLPRTRISNSDGEEVSTEPMYSCTDLYIPGPIAQLGVLNVSSFNLDDKSIIRSTGLMASGWNVYASQKNLYVSMSSQAWFWGGDETNDSHIHKFELSATGEAPRYLASGMIDGWILNQFSLSEHNGYLRVATTDNRWTRRDGEQGGNHLIVLGQNGDLLQETGSVRDLAPGERVYSARFMGDRGYVVTFFEVDPLYTFDLSDPYNPKMLGELKIEGFSSYMHPVGENHLLAIGRDGDEFGMMTGVHLQIFDVSDMTNPTRTHHHVISTGGWSSDSEAMWNHHAFTYHAGKEILAIPMNIWENDDQFTGLMVFDAGVDGFNEVGRISHGDLVSDAHCVERGLERGCEITESRWNWWSNMRRSIFMSSEEGEDFVYSLSTTGLKVNELYQPDVELARVLFN